MRLLSLCLILACFGTIKFISPSLSAPSGDAKLGAIAARLITIYQAAKYEEKPAEAIRPSIGEPGDADLEAANDQVIALYHAGKYDEAIKAARSNAVQVEARYSENSSLYRTALYNLAQLLQATSQLAEAELLYRRRTRYRREEFRAG